MIEREFKFIARPKHKCSDLWVKLADTTYDIEQAYLLENEHIEVRIRKLVRLSDGQASYKETVKITTSDPSKRREAEWDLTAEEFDELVPCAISKITKRRTEIPISDTTSWCIDWYRDLSLCIVEFESPEETPVDEYKRMIEEWVELKEDVTADPQYKTKELAKQVKH